MIRLDTYPLGEPGKEPATLSGLLHSGVLSPHQELAVWVGDVSQHAVNEDGQAVFAWQCGVETLMEIHLRQHGYTIRAWRGWWRGGTTLAHTGTLTFPVFCAGLPQPAGFPEGTTPPSTSPTPSSSSLLLSAASERLNGTATAVLAPSSAPTAVLEWPALAEAPRTVVSLPAPETSAPEDDLWGEVEVGTQEMEASGEDASTREEEELEELEEQEEEENGREAETEEEAHHRREPEAGHTLSETAAPTSPAPILSVPAGATVAAIHAATIWSQTEHERVIQELAHVLATMPAKTILVDLRRHPPMPRSSRRIHQRAAYARLQPLGLTKERLRSQYGACYWDRGSSISTSRRREEGRPPRWYQVVDQPASAAGLDELVNALTRGFSLLFFDSAAPYAESARAAVIAELRGLLPTLGVGFCS